MMKAAILDFDGVIADTERTKFETVNMLLSREGLKIEKEDFSSFIGKKTGNILREKFPSLSSVKSREIAEKRREMELSNINSIKLIPGIRELLTYMKDEHYRIAICTGSRKPFVMRILEKNSLTQYFNVIVTGEDFSSSKPNPEGFLIALERLGAQKENCIIIEDSPAGLQAAKSAGIKSYAIETYFQKDNLFSGDKIFSGHSDILSYLKGH